MLTTAHDFKAKVWRSIGGQHFICQAAQHTFPEVQLIQSYMAAIHCCAQALGTRLPDCSSPAARGRSADLPAAIMLAAN